MVYVGLAGFGILLVTIITWFINYDVRPLGLPLLIWEATGVSLIGLSTGWQLMWFYFIILLIAWVIATIGDIPIWKRMGLDVPDSRKKALKHSFKINGVVSVPALASFLFAAALRIYVF